MGIRNAVRAFWAGLPTSGGASYEAVSKQNIYYKYALNDGSDGVAIADTNLEQLRNMARGLLRDDPLVVSLHAAHIDNIIGGKGIRPQLQLSDKPEAATAIEQGWRAWCMDCDERGQFDMLSLQEQMISSWLATGEILITLSDVKGELKIKVLDPEFLALRNEQGNNIVQGVQLDANNLITHYYLHKSAPSQRGHNKAITDSSLIKAPAKNVLHAFKTDRAGAYRGLTPLAPALINQGQLKQLTEAEIKGTKLGAVHVGFITQQPNYSSMATGGEAKGGAPQPVAITPGAVPKLEPGEDFRAAAVRATATNFDTHHQIHARRLAACFGVAYATITGDLSNANFSSARVALIRERDYWRRQQNWLSRAVLSKIFRAWLAYGSGRAILADHGISLTNAMSACRWQGRGWSWVDPLKEVNATNAALSHGTATVAQVLAETRGDDLDDHIKTLKLERDKYNQAGIAHPLDQAAIAQTEPDEAQN